MAVEVGNDTIRGAFLQDGSADKRLTGHVDNLSRNGSGLLTALGGSSGGDNTLVLHPQINKVVLDLIGHSVATKNPVEHFLQGRIFHIYQRSEEHTSELQSRQYLVCRLL